MQAHIKITGGVKGVGFRVGVVEQARMLNLKGWTKNVHNGVEILCQGEEENVKKMVMWCQRGPILASVEDVQVEYIKKTDFFPDFKIVM